jgi:hypothetical protein
MGENNGTRTEDPKQNVDFVENCISIKDFIVVRFSVTNAGMSSSSSFRFQGKLVEVNRIQESVYSFICTGVFFLWASKLLCPGIKMPLYTFLHNLLNVLVHIANKIG